jgi:adenylate cyclase
MTVQNPNKGTLSPQTRIAGLSPQKVRDVLGRVLGHPEFLASEKRREFLKFVVEETLAGRADQIHGYTVATAVFGRGADFDPGNDPIVRIEAGKLRRELERYYLVAGGEDPIRIDIPKGRYVPLFIEQSGSANGAAALPVSAPSVGIATPSVAIMPLENLTDDAGQDYFVDGLVSELAVELGRYQDIIAIRCQSPGPSPNDAKGAKMAGSQLGARFLLGGTLRKDSERAKVTLQLTDTATGRQVWSEAYSCNLNPTEVISTQESIARDVIATTAGEAGIISQRLSREVRNKKPSDLTTYEAILRYHYYMRMMTPETYRDAFAALLAAVEREPDYGPACSAFANMHCHAYIWDLPEFGEPLETAAGYAARGAQTDPANQLTRTIMAYVHFLRGELESARSEADVALSLNPNSPYFTGTIGYVLVFAGDFDRGRNIVETSIALNPCHPRWFHHAFWLDDYRQERYESSYGAAVTAGPNLGFWYPVVCAASLGMLERKSQARAFFEELQKLKPDFERRARELMARVLKIDSITEQVIEGLRKAGLDVQ